MKLCTFVDAGNANLMGVAPLTDAHCLLIDISVMRDKIIFTDYLAVSFFAWCSQCAGKDSVFAARTKR